MAGKDDVRVRIGADAKELKTALGEAQGLMSRFARSGATALRPLDRAFGGALSSIFSLKGAIASAIGGGGLGLLVKQSIDAADGIAKMADRTGLSIAAVQEFTHAARQAGVTVEELESGLGFMNRRIAAGKTAYGDAETGLRTVADQLLATENGATRAGIAAAAFGEDAGRKLLPMLIDGAEGLNTMAAEAHRLGLVLDADLVRNAERAGDQVELLSNVVQTNLHAALLSVAPLIGDMSTKLSVAARELGLFWQSFVPREGKSAEGLREELANLNRSLATELNFVPPVDILDRVFGADEARAARIEKLRADIATVEAMITAMENRPAPAVGALPGGNTDKTRDVAEALNFEIDQLGRTAIELELYSRAKAAGVEVTSAFRAEIEPLIAMLMGEKDALDASAKAQKDRDAAAAQMSSRAAQIWDATRTPLEQYNTALAEANELLQAGALDWDTYGRRVEQAQGQLETAAEKTGDVNETARDLGLTFTSAFEDAVVAGAKLSDVLQGLYDDLVRIATRKLVTEPLGDAVGGLFGGIDWGALLDGFFGVGGSGGATASARAAGAFGSARGNVFARPVLPHAKGAVLTSPIAFPMAGGRVGTAAERGAEAIMPLARDSQGRLGVHGGGGAVNVEFQVIDQRGSGAPVETRQSRGADGRLQIQAWVRDEVRTGIAAGAFDPALGTAFGLRRRGASR